MDRRTYLTALGGAAVALSGCSEGDSTESDTATGSPATGHTPTRTSEKTPRPTVRTSGLLLEPDAFDTLDSTDSVGRGGTLVLGLDFDLPVSDGAAQGLVEARVFDSSDSRVASKTSSVDSLADDGTESARHVAWLSFDTTGWALGSYTAELLVNDRSYGTTVSTAEAFDVVEPLGPGEVELRLAEFPADVVAGETFGWTLGFRNRTDRDSSVVTDTVTLDPARSAPVELDIAYRENVPAGEETLVEIEDNSLRYPGTYTYRIDDIDAEVSFTVSPPD